VAVFPCAKNTGLASTFQDAAHRRIVAAVCFLEYLVALAIAFYIQPVGAACMLFAAALSLVWYDLMSKKQFGGITGDLAGWFLQVCECLMAAAVVVGDLLWF
jgi:adenosylcobinamide-GDP ribazoletransferase